VPKRCAYVCTSPPLLSASVVVVRQSVMLRWQLRQVGRAAVGGRAPRSSGHCLVYRGSVQPPGEPHQRATGTSRSGRACRPGTKRARQRLGRREPTTGPSRGMTPARSAGRSAGQQSSGRHSQRPCCRPRARRACCLGSSLPPLASMSAWSAWELVSGDRSAADPARRPARRLPAPHTLPARRRPTVAVSRAHALVAHLTAALPREPASNRSRGLRRNARPLADLTTLGYAPS
jgi:hypothetical protein